MNVRWSDVIALSAISAGALFPLAVMDSVRAHNDSHFVHVDARPHIVVEVQPEACVDQIALEILEARRSALGARVGQIRAEATRMRSEAERVRVRVRIELDRHRSELAASSARSEELRREVVEAATNDLLRMSIARVDAENAMTDALGNLEVQIMELEAQVESDQAGAQHDKKRRRRRGPPCRRPGRRHPGR